MKAIGRLALDRRGNVAIIFALLTPLFVIVAGLAVDTSKVEAAKWSMQRSLDAAALGAAKEFGRTSDHAEIEKWARAMFFANEARGAQDNTDFVYEGVTRVGGDNVLRVSASRDEPTFFGTAIKGLTGGRIDHETWHLAMSSEVVVRNRSVEMALVLDNSGSMRDPPAGGGTVKMTTLKDATERLVEQLLAPRPLANNVDPVKISVVPFAGSVNVGTQYANASWMDTVGINPMHHDDVDWTTWQVAGRPQATQWQDGSWRDPAGNPLTRFTLFNLMRAHRFNSIWAWGGCIASRPDGYAVTDAAPTSSRPATLFVPLFSPAEFWRGDYQSARNAYINDWVGPGADNMANLRRQRDVTRYIAPGRIDTTAAGPNSLCTTSEITPLTASRSTVLSAVRAMQPLGGTNIAEGLAWGWRTLSSGEPFTQGRPRDTKENLKVLVLMTDGENTYNPSLVNGPQIEFNNANRSAFGTYGFGQSIHRKSGQHHESLQTGRMFEATPSVQARAAIANITESMNVAMSLVCENMKKDGSNDDGGDGVVVFTIAFDLKDGSPVKERLRNCASNGIDGRGAKLYYDARNSNDLLAAFSAISDEISALRIAR